MSDPPFRLKGVAGFGLALIAGRVIQAIAFFVMARILEPSQMGVVAILAVLFVAFFQMTNLGFDRYIVYAESESATSLTTAVDAVWTLQLLRGLIILVALVPVSFSIEQFTDLNVGFLYVSGIGGVVVLLSLVHPGLSQFEREGNFSLIARARAVSVSVGGVVTILLVLMWPFPWVYVIGQLVSALIMVGMSFFYANNVPHILVNAKSLSEVLSFGKHIIVIATVSFLSAQAQHAYVGVLFGSATLGAYYTWERFVSLPRELVQQISDKILFAMASDRARQNVNCGFVYLIGFAATMAVMIPFNLMIWFHGDSIIGFVAGEKWQEFFWVGKIFVLISVCYSIAGSIGPFMLVLYPHITSLLRTVEALGVVLLMVVLGPKYGVFGVLIALLIIISIALVIRIFVLYKFIIISNRVKHAVMMVSVLLIIGGPILLWENGVQMILPQGFQLMGVMGFYLVFFLSIVSLAYTHRDKIIQELK